MAYNAYVNYQAFFSTPEKVAVAVSIMGGQTGIAIKPSDAAAMLGLDYPPPSGPRPLDGLIICPPYVLGMNIPHPGPSGVILDGASDNFFVPRQTPGSGMPPGDDMILSWSLSIICLGPEYSTGDPGLIAPIPQRRWTMGFETPLLFEFRGAASAFIGRDASRVIDGIGGRIRNDTGGYSANLSNTTATGLPSRQSWERFYLRIRRFGTADFILWRSGGSVGTSSGGMLRLFPDGTIQLLNVSTFGVETLLTTTGALAIDTWYKIDILVQYATAVLNGGLRVYINNNFAAGAVVGTGGVGLGQNQNHSSSTFISITTPHTWEFDVDDWHNAEIPNIGGIETLNSIDWLTGTHCKLVNVISGTAVNWTGIPLSLNQARSELASGLSLTATIALSTINMNTNAIDYLNLEEQDLSGFVFGAACAAIITYAQQSAGGVGTGRLGYSLGGGGIVWQLVNPGGGISPLLHTYLPNSGSLVPYLIEPMTVNYEKKNSADSSTVNVLTAIVQYVGQWGLEDIPADVLSPGEFLGPIIHNCIYPNTTWSRLGAPPDAPICVATGTYVGNGTNQIISSLTHLISPQPFHFLIIRNTVSGAPVVLNSTMFGPEITSGSSTLAGDIPLIGYDVLNATSYFVVNGNGPRVNQLGTTYQFFTIHDPSMRFIINGEYAHGQVAGLHGNAILDNLFTPEFAFLFSGPSSGSLWTKGPSNPTLEVQNMGGSAVNNVLQFGTGQFVTDNGILSSTNAVSYSFFRTSDGSNLTMIQITTYVGNGINPRVIPLTPTTNRFPLVAFVQKRGTPNQSTFYRDAFHAGVNSCAFNSGGNVANGIVGAGIDSISVGSSLNAVGGVYDVFVIVGTASGWLNGVYCGPNGVAPGDFWDPDPVELPPQVLSVGEGGLTIGGDASLTLLKDISGIYTLVPGKRNDTLYDRQTGQSSIDMEIPDPTFKTGYVGG